jgi:hypothetical protein
MDAAVGPGILYELPRDPKALREGRQRIGLVAASVLGERFCLLSAGLLPGV